jgi:hypothetical protein
MADWGCCDRTSPKPSPINLFGKERMTIDLILKAYILFGTAVEFNLGANWRSLGPPGVENPRLTVQTC